MRNISLDLLKILLSVFVMLLHLKFLAFYNEDVSYSLVNGLFRIAVPTFLLINGYFIHTIIYSDAFFKNLKKLATLYITWMLIYSYFWAFNSSLLDIILSLVFGYHLLWYIPGLILSSVLLRFLRNKPTNRLLIISISLYLTGLIIQYYVNSGHINKIINNEQLKILLYRNFLFDCFPFLCLGFLLKKLNIDTFFSRINKNVSFAILAFSVCLLISESLFNKFLFGTNRPVDLFLFSIPTSVLIFLIVVNTSISGNSKSLSNFSTAIFFVHVFCLKATNKFFDFMNIKGNYLYLATVIVVTFMLSVFLTYLKKIFTRLSVL